MQRNTYTTAEAPTAVLDNSSINLWGTETKVTAIASLLGKGIHITLSSTCFYYP